MAFPFVALAMAGLGFASSLMQSSQNRSAQASNKKDVKKVNKANYDRAVLEDDILWEQQGAAYAWDMVKTEAMRFQERQKMSDYDHRTDAMFDQALNNLQLNSSALFDKYNLEEGLRATEQTIKLQSLAEVNKNTRQQLIGESRTKSQNIKQQSRQAKAQQDTADFNYAVQRQNLARQAKLNEKATTQQVYELLKGVQAKRRQRNILRLQLEQKGVSLQEQDGLEMSQKLMERDMQSLASAFEGASTRATSAARSGGSATGRRLAMNAAQQFGRTYGQIRMLKQGQMARNAQFNAEVQGPRAREMAQLAQDMMVMAERSGNAIKQQKIRNRALKDQQLGVINERENALKGFKITQNIYGNQLKGEARGLRAARKKVDQSYGQARRQTKKLLLPSFDIAKRQGVREMSGLYLQTDAAIEQASTPFRESIIFDPIEPIRGLRPQKLTPTTTPVQSPMSQYGNALIAGVDQALKFSEMTSTGLKFY